MKCNLQQQRFPFSSSLAVGAMMEPTDGSPPNSMYMVRCGEMFPKPAIEKEDDKLVVPFKERECGGNLFTRPQ